MNSNKKSDEVKKTNKKTAKSSTKKTVKKEEVKEVKKTIKEDNDMVMFEEKKHKGLYFGYTSRVVVNCLILVLLSTATLILLSKSVSIIKAHVINYKKTTDVDYKVYLKDNSFYEQEYLGKNMSYISTLIKNINTTFYYDVSANEKNDMKLTYDIVGTLKIMDSTHENTFYEKDYTLLESKEVVMKDSKKQTIRENIDIDYGKYNSIANDFRNKFGVSTTSNFTVALRVKSSGENLKNNETEKLTLNIPLSEREVKINFSTDTKSNNESIIKKAHVKIDNIWFLGAAGICLLGTIIALVKLLKKIFMVNTKKSAYDLYIAKILKEYDRFIANTQTGPIVRENSEVIKLDSFQELLDVRNNLKVPCNIC